MRRIFIGIVLLVSLNGAQAQTQAVFQLRAMTGLTDYEFSYEADSLLRDLGVNVDASNADSIVVVFGENQTFTSDQMDKFSAGDTVLMAGLGGTAIYGDYFFDAYFQTNDTGEQKPLSSNPEDRPSFTNVDIINIDRDDVGFAIGRSFGSYSISIGFKGSQTEFNQSYINSLDPVNLGSVFKLDGPFISAAYGVVVAGGVIGFNVAVADLDGEWKFSRTGFNSVGTDQAKFTGSSTGVTLGVSWKKPINDDWSYSLGADYYDYSFDISSEISFDIGSGPRQATGNVSVEESVFALKSSLIYTF